MLPPVEEFDPVAGRIEIGELVSRWITRPRSPRSVLRPGLSFNESNSRCAGAVKSVVLDGATFLGVERRAGYLARAF